VNFVISLTQSNHLRQDSAHLQVQSEFGHDELIEAHAFGFRFAGQGGVERLGHAHIELAAVLPALRPNDRFGQVVDESVDLPAFFCLRKGRSVLGGGK
jgi:hypothetical protein